MRIPALKVHQWLDDWEGYRFSSENRQRKPQKYFYVASIPVALLRRLSNVPRRGEEVEGGKQEAVGPRIEDIGIQRGQERDRVKDIQDFVVAGYPYATLRKVEKDRFPQLRKPGWLPTALVVNLVRPSSVRQNTAPHSEDLIRIDETKANIVELILPENADKTDWKPKGDIYPLEVIDGQHRLLAFDQDDSINGVFELPVVLFDDLDISWQAYLFWTINITPKRIGPSLAYDLYPLLRTEDWLEPVAGPLAYRETRAQELTEALWSNPASPWYERIGMLGRERGKVTQAAFVRSLALSFIRRSDMGRGRPGGLFGAPLSSDTTNVLRWSRAQQAAYLIFLWIELRDAIQQTSAAWALDLRNKTSSGEHPDPEVAFSGIHSLLATDQGVRGFLQVTNDLSFILADYLDLPSCLPDNRSEATNIDEVRDALAQLQSNPRVRGFARALCETMADFDWRSSATPGLRAEIRNRQALYRAGSGYREVRRQLLFHLADHGTSPIKETASLLVEVLKFNTDEDEV